LGPPAVLGRFDSCDLPPFNVSQTLLNSTRTPCILALSHDSVYRVQPNSTHIK
jgi:hypothetical protein